MVRRGVLPFDRKSGYFLFPERSDAENDDDGNERALEILYKCLNNPSFPLQRTAFVEQFIAKFSLIYS